MILVGAAVVAGSQRAEARVRLESICTIYGQREIKLTGIGLVIGLNGTGDGGKNAPAMRALAQTMKLMNSPVESLKELRDANNVAMVLIEATVPKTGVRPGQQIDCYVSSFMGAKSLRGGRLLVSPMEEADIGSEAVVGLASGPLSLEEVEIPTSAKIPRGLVLQKSFPALFIDKERGYVITLMLDAGHSSFHAASEVARVINGEFSFEAGNKKIARATGPGVVEVYVPKQYQDTPVEFVAEVLDVGIDNPHTQARVVVNPKSQTVIVTGEVEISPVVISHLNLTVEVGGDAQFGGRAPKRFVAIDDRRNATNSAQLQNLVDALNQLRVPTSEIIKIVRELHHSGKLHAEYVEH